MNAQDRLWGRLDDALARLCETGAADFWLRDDDAVAPSPALDRLIGLAKHAAIPLALAVIPAGAEPALADRLAPLESVTVLQHGYAHADHAAPGGKKCELGPERPVATVLAELAAGRDRLAMFARVRPMLVPPWNRVDEAVAAGLPGLGFTALSLYGARAAPRDAAGLLRLNTHVDPVDWRGTRSFIGREPALDMLLRRLARILASEDDPSEPTGILTHHLVHEPEAFDFLADLFKASRKHIGLRWLSVDTLLGLKALSRGGDAL